MTELSIAGADTVYNVGTAGATPLLSEPPGWPSLSFDDSTWPASADGFMSEYATVDPLGSQGAHWVTYPGYAVDLPGPGGQQWLLRHRFTLPTGDLLGATLTVAPDDFMLAAYINGVQIGGRQTAGFGQTCYLSFAGALLRPGGTNVLALEITNGATSAPGPTRLQFVLTLTPSSTTGSAGGGWSSGLPTGSWLQLVHGSGPVVLSSDGTTTYIKSRDKIMVQTPFPSLTAQPAAILGKDPVSGLPMWTGEQDSSPPVPPPPPVSHSYTQVDRSLEDTSAAPIPLPVPPSPQRVCGAAYQMTALLCSVYDAVVQAINVARTRIITAFTQALKDDLQAQIVSLLAEGEFGQFEIDGLQIALNILAAIVETLLAWGTRLPTIEVANPGDAGVSQFQIVRCAAWSALWLTGGDYFSEAKSADGLGTRDYWLQQLGPQWSFFAGSTIAGISISNPPWQLVWLNDIIAAVPDAGWARAAWIGAQRPQTTCTSCPGYPP